ncbi:MAG TPA: prolyl oligopeptidase family serine peptidase [Armatimonadota bacterium]|nr:prolyl oligopeptidase family serine peptidase [Armatimonadota bacterium]
MLISVLALLTTSSPASAQEASPVEPVEHEIREFTVPVGERELMAKILSPPDEDLAEAPALLLTFAADQDTSLLTIPYCLPAQHFLAHGHRAVSFTLPSHGTRVDAFGEGIAGWRNAFMAGEDPFSTFVAEARALIDECMRRGWVRPGRIAVSGTSRGGYVALRLLAADPRIAAGAGFAPVTDWRDLTEFSADREREDVAGLRLSQMAADMADRDVFAAIGRNDDRVSTLSCRTFIEHLRRLGATTSDGSDRVRYVETDDEGHSLADRWYAEGAEFLLRAATRTDGSH